MTTSAYDMLRSVAAPSEDGGSTTNTLPLAKLHPDPTQPRQSFDEAALTELATSIEQSGIIEPLVVTPDPDRAGEWIILVGERRHRAAAKVGLEEVPVVVRTEVSPTERLILQLTENDQRKDLTLRERAQGYMRLRNMMEDKTLSELAAMLGKKCSAFTNTLLAAKVTQGPAFEALQEDLIKDPDALRLFTAFPGEDQKKLLATARTTGVTLTRLMLQRFKDTRKKSAEAAPKRSAAPPDASDASEGPEAHHQAPPDGDPEPASPASDPEDPPRVGAGATSTRGAEAGKRAPKSAVTVLSALTWRHWQILFNQLGLPLPEDPEDAGYTLLEFLEAQAADE
jgi:ParB/RepB/Spo0J family partition protein